jgi:hypothetical protein
VVVMVGGYTILFGGVLVSVGGGEIAKYVS